VFTIKFDLITIHYLTLIKLILINMSHTEIGSLYYKLLSDEKFIENDNVDRNEYGDVNESCYNVPDGKYCNMVRYCEGDEYCWMFKSLDTIIFINITDEPFMTLGMSLIEKDVCVKIYLNAEHREPHGAGIQIMRKSKQSVSGYDWMYKINVNKRGYEEMMPFRHNTGDIVSCNYDQIIEFLDIFVNCEIKSIFIDFDAIKEILFDEKSKDLPRWFEASKLTDAIGKYMYFPKTLQFNPIII